MWTGKISSSAGCSPESPARSTLLICVLFFLSGAAGMMYEISWSRQVGLLFGHTVHAASVVLAVFFVGIAAGNAWGGRWAQRISPLFGYGIAELGAAAWACLIPLGLMLLETPFLSQWISSTSPGLQTLLRVGVVFLLLFPATTALGVTLPFIAEAVSPRGRSSKDRVALVYGVNTAGAMVGVVLTTGILLLMLGVAASGYLAAMLSALCGLGAMLLAKRGVPDSPRQSESEIEPPSGNPSDAKPGWKWLVAAGISGFSLLALEVLYTRMFSLVFHNSSYTFGAVVAVFLAGLALGSIGVSILGKRWSADRIIAWCAALGAIGIPLSVLLFVALTGLDYFTFGNSFTEYLAGALGLVAAVVLLPVGLLGMVLPGIWQGVLYNAHSTGWVVGRLTAVNTLSAAAGSLFASLVLLPVCGLWGSLILVGALPGGIALLFLRSSVGSLITSMVLATLSVLALAVPVGVREQLLTPEQRILVHWESPYGWVELVQNDKDGSVKLVQNLHYGLGTVAGRNPHYRQGTIPILLHEHPQDVLFLGLGTGMTAGSVIPHEEVENITVVELIPDVVRAARRLSKWNNHLVDHPKVEIRIDDARHFLLGTPTKYDVIVSELFVPWESQTGYLYTVENYRAVRNRLKPGGLFCQWLPLYQMGAGQFEMIANSFATVFPETTVWWGFVNRHTPVIGLIGSETPLEADGKEIDRRLQSARLSPAEVDSYISSASELFFLYVGHWLPPKNNLPLNTDEHPRIEFLTPLAQWNAELVRRDNLKTFFEQSLSQLPQGDIHLHPSPQAEDPMLRDRMQWQRWLLFGSTEPPEHRPGQ